MEIIKELIVVEGKNDEYKMKENYECDVFITDGYNITIEKLKFLKQAQKERGLILFLDPDVVGNKIRKKINDYIPNCKNAFLDQANAKTEKKIGIEHASNEDIKLALQNLITFTDCEETITKQFLLSLNLTGNTTATKRRNKLAKKLHLGKCNFKTLHKRLNMITITEQEIIAILERGE